MTTTGLTSWILSEVSLANKKPRLAEKATLFFISSYWFFKIKKFLTLVVKNKTMLLKKKHSLLSDRDYDRIQTCDRWSRNPVLYSAELRSLYYS